MRTKLTGELAERGDHDHPTATHPEVTSVTEERHTDVDAEKEQRCPHDSLHDDVDRVGEVLAGNNGNDPEDRNNESVADEIAGRIEQRLARGVLRSGDVSDGRDVIPVDAMAKTEPERRHD